MVPESIVAIPKSVAIPDPVLLTSPEIVLAESAVAVSKLVVVVPDSVVVVPEPTVVPRSVDLSESAVVDTNQVQVGNTVKNPEASEVKSEKVFVPGDSGQIPVRAVGPALHLYTLGVP